jgi:virginiamycin B lyase
VRLRGSRRTRAKLVDCDLTGGRTLLLFVLVLALVGALAAQASAAVYWANGHSIGRMNFDGTNPSPGLISSYSEPLGSACGLAVDGSHIFWADRWGNTISRADLEGKDRRLQFITGANQPCGVAVAAGYIYWANLGGDSIGRAKLDGTEVSQEFIPAVSKPCGVAVNGNFIYWASWANYGYVGQALLQSGARGPNLVEFETPLDYSLCGVAASEDHVFFGGFGDAIGRVATDGLDPEPRYITGVQSPCAIAIHDGQLYFAEISQWWNGLGHISRSGLDGSRMEHGIVTGLDYPCGIAVDSLSFGPSYIAPPPLPNLTPCKIDRLKLNQRNGSALVRLTGPVDGDFGVVNRGLRWRVVSKKPPASSHQAAWRWWISVQPAIKGRAASRLHRRLDDRGRAPIKLRINCSEEGSVTNKSVKRFVLRLAD